MKRPYIVLTLLVFLFVLSNTGRAQSGWIPQSSGTSADLYDIVTIPSSSNISFVVGDSGIFLRTFDYGVKWDRLTDSLLEGKKLIALDFPYPDTGFIAAEDGTFIRVNGATGQNPIFIGQTGRLPGRIPIRDMSFFPFQKFGLIVGDSGKIFRTSNYNNPLWQTQNVPTTKNLHSVFVISVLRACAVGDSGTILLQPTINNWQRITNIPEVYQTTNFRSVTFVAAGAGFSDTGFVVGEQGAILKTTNDGNNWLAQPSGVTGTLRGAFFSPRNDFRFRFRTGWVVGDGGLILKTEDQGETWTQLNSGTTSNLYRVAFSDSLTGITVGENGTILRTTTGGDYRPLISIAPSVFDFGPVVIASSKTASVAVANKGVTTLHISSITSSNPLFTVSTYSDTIASNTTKNYEITFTPSSTGFTSGTIFLTHNALDSLTTIPISGRGINPIVPSSWFWQNPLPQGNRLYDVEFVDAAAAFAVGELGTVMKTTDAGVTWNVLNYAGGTPNDLNAVSFYDAKNGAAVGTHGTIVRTTDGGINWASQPSGTTVNLNALTFNDMNTGIAVGGSNVFGPEASGVILRTIDAGQTWIPVFSDLPAAVFNDVAFADANTGVVVGVWLGGNILRTTDGGLNWAPVRSEINAYLSAVTFVNSQKGFAVGVSGAMNGTLLQTTDAGLTWSSIPIGVPRWLYDISFANEFNGIAVGAYGTILYTANSGTTWMQAPNGSSDALLAASLTEGNIGLAVGNGGDPFFSGFTHGGTLLRTTNAGATWTSQVTVTTRRTLRSVSFIDVNTGTAVGDSGTVLRTTNGGESWVKQLTGTLFEYFGYAYHSVHFVDQEVGFAVGSKGTVIKTTNSGDHWTALGFGTTNTLRAITMVDATTGWVVGDSGAIYKTTDGGIHWASQSKISPTQLNAVSFSDVQKGLVVGNKGLILYTSDGGVNWIPQSSGTGNDLFGVVMHSDTGIAVGEGGIILSTTNSGTIWTEHDFGDGSALRGIVLNGLHGTIVGDNGTILRSTDAGFTWAYQASGTSSHLNAVSFVNENIGAVVGTFGTILRTTTGGVVGVEESPVADLFPQRFKLDQNYPNPFNPVTVISFQLPVSSWVTLKVYDVLGREVETLVSEELKPGRYEVTWDARQFASGVYFYQIKAGNYLEVKKALLLR
ncbi:MAG: T9SS type A sorting domain-containing protein [Ignavibacteriae bacterium]|nr:T9SS type A sorting domain-containing protein [Ignavibacteriota bacterium]